MSYNSDFSPSKKQKPSDFCFSDSSIHKCSSQPSSEDCSIWQDTPSGVSDDLWAAKAASSTECTGLIPALPDSEEERKAYEELYPPNIPDSAVPRQPRSIPNDPSV